MIPRFGLSELEWGWIQFEMNQIVGFGCCSGPQMALGDGTVRHGTAGTLFLGSIDFNHHFVDNFSNELCAIELCAVFGDF